MRAGNLYGPNQAWMKVLLFGGLIFFANRLPAQAPAQGQDASKPANSSGQAVPTNTVIKTESRVVLVDAVVTDKKGHYVTDLAQDDFKVFEDNKEQAISSFSYESDPARQAAGQRHYMILFFDNSSMEMGDQMQARKTAAKFIESNAGPDRLMAVVNFGGSLVIRQNFTGDARLLQAAVTANGSPNIDTNGQNAPPMQVAMNGAASLSNAEADFGARTMLLSIRSLAKNLRAVPGRKMLILFTAGFPLSTENMSELTATIDACNKANVAIYSLDVRGLVAGMPAGSAMFSLPENEQNSKSARTGNPDLDRKPRLVLASYSRAAMLDPQKPGGGGGGTGGTGGTGGGGHSGTGTGGTGGTGTSGSGGGKGGTGTSGSGGGKGGTGTGTGGTGRGTGGAPPPASPYANY